MVFSFSYPNLIRSTVLAAACGFFASELYSQGVLPIRVTPQATIEYAPVVTDLIDPASVKGLKVVGVRPKGQKFQMMGQLVPRGDKVELHFLLQAGIKGVPQDFDVILQKPTVSYPEIFSIKEESPSHIDLFYNRSGVTVKLSRMLTEYKGDFGTAKVFNHVYGTRGLREITSGGGEAAHFPHHRGIFLGWSKTEFKGKTYDTWHVKDGVHQKFEKLIAQNVGPIYADYTALISWKTGEDDTILEEERTIKALHPTNKGFGVLEVDTLLKAINGDVVLDGDPEHAGCQFRASNGTAEIALKVKEGKAPKFQATRYAFHKAGVDPKKDLDLPWVTMGFSIEEDRYFVQLMSHPDVPKGNIYSAYREYGRFGSFCKATIKDGESLRLRYKFIFGIGAISPVDFMHSSYEAFATPPVVTLAPATEKTPAEKK